MESSVKIQKLRELMSAQGVDVYLIPRADEFQGEFVAPYAERLSWLTGFTGSAGLAVVTADKAVLFTDARYALQAPKQVDGSIWEVVDSAQTKAVEWLQKHAADGVIGLDPWLHTIKDVKAFEEKALVLKLLESNLIDEIWPDQPGRPDGTVTDFSEAIAGKSAQQKCAEIAQTLEKAGADALLLTMPDSVCWLSNTRGHDVENIPVALCYGLLKADGSFTRMHGPGDAAKAFLTLTGKTVMLDEASCPAAFHDILRENDIHILAHADPCIPARACKTPQEIAAIKQAHIADGVALSMWLKWLEEGDVASLTEMAAAQKLHELRSQHQAFKGDSFPTIAGFGANGAIVHYRAVPETDTKLADGGLLLLDNGGQYLTTRHPSAGGEWAGTTDITRTIALGQPSKEMKENFTRVLKGHIALARAKFPAGTTGAQLDTLARQPLWDAGLDFAHGTGHGVGCYLQVHESGIGISPRSHQELKPGMLISNEPGYYKEGAYGIRIENLVIVTETGGKNATGKDMLGFETVSLAPIDLTLVEPDLLSPAEKDWLNAYHSAVYGALSPHLDDGEQAWLKEKAQAV